MQTENRPKRRWRRILCTVVAATAICALPTLSRAQSASTSAADQLFQEAVEMANQGMFETAATKFKASHEIDPTLGALLGLAMAEQRCGRLGSAYQHYQELLALARKSDDAPRQQEALQRMQAIEAEVPRLTIKSTRELPRGTTVLLDSVLLPIEALGNPVPVDPGEHTVKVASGQGDLLNKSMTVSPGQHIVLELAWTPSAQPSIPSALVAKPSNRQGWRTAGLVTAGASVAMIAAGTYLWVRSDQTYNEVASACPGAGCAVSMRDRIDTGKTQETWSRISLVLGGLGLATGATLFVLGSSHRNEPGQAKVTFGPASVRLAVIF